MTGFLRRLRGALGNAVVWAAGWAGLSLILSFLFYAVGFVFPFMPFWTFAFLLGRTFALFGFLTGGAFSLYLSIAARNRRLEELSPGLFGVCGGVAAGLVLPLVGVVLNALSGSPQTVWQFVPVGVITGLLGGATAYGTIRIAQASAPELADGTMAGLSPGRGRGWADRG